MDKPTPRDRKLAEIRAYAAANNCSFSSITRTQADAHCLWLLGEVDRLTRERDRARAKFKLLRRVIRDWLIPIDPE